MSRLLKNLQQVGWTFVFGVVLLEARGEDYLPCVGPTPLRFEMVMAHGQSSFALPSSNAVVKTSDTNANPAMANSASGTNMPSLVAGETDEKAFVDLDASSNPVVLQPLADGLLNVTPQMLVDYFKPVDGTNSTGVVVLPEKVGFLPPVMPGANPSRAVYKTQ